ncbi:META domain-containing protein [Wenzhouxiangella sp. EGI_FJ10305]|uniref:META domain-containing protein n=1 Tax=Wenzhouxiangella sp. EGI_FJ10305 TaxID=3243768 RepID=UPI0035DDE39A
MMRGTMLAAATLWLAGCTWTVDMRSDDGEPGVDASEPFFIEAELFYPERVALPGDAELLVAVDAVGREGRTTLTRFSTRLEGHQVPIPLGFTVEPENSDPVLYELSAAILSGDRLLRLTGPTLVLPRDGRARMERIHLRHPLEAGFGQSWQCDSTGLMFGAVGEQVFLAVDRQLHALEPVPADSGLRYQSVGDSGIGIHEKSGDIQFIRDEEPGPECRRVTALEPPLSGGGNEPGWQVTIDDDHIELTSDYGQTSTEASLIGSGSSGLTTRFRGIGDNGPILAAFGQSVCRDSATGMPHPYSVEVQFDGGRLDGCGGRPRDLLLGTDWRVTRLDGEAVPETGADDEEVMITIAFDAEDRVSGRAACNRFTADYELGGEGLSISPAASTRMACREPRMQLESRFLDLLGSVRRFNIGADGELVLITTGGRITAVAQD